MPLVLVGRDGNRRTVVAVDPLAEAAGLHVGMPTAKAQALVPRLAVIEADPAGGTLSATAPNAIAKQLGIGRVSPYRLLTAGM